MRSDTAGNLGLFFSSISSCVQYVYLREWGWDSWDRISLSLPSGEVGNYCCESWNARQRPRTRNEGESFIQNALEMEREALFSKSKNRTGWTSIIDFRGGFLTNLCVRLGEFCHESRWHEAQGNRTSIYSCSFFSLFFTLITFSC